MYRQAYLVFSSKQKVEEAIKKFKSERPRLDDRRLILIRWNPKRVLPTGILTLCLMFPMLCVSICMVTTCLENNLEISEHLPVTKLGKSQGKLLAGKTVYC